MTINQTDIVFREWPQYTHFWLTGQYEHICGSNPIELPPGSTVSDAAARFETQIARLQDENDLRKFISIPSPLDIARAADDYLQMVLDNLTDIHSTLKSLNLYGSSDDATEAAVNSSQDTKAVTLRNALTAYRNGWVGQFATEQDDARNDPTGWKQALKNFVSNNLGNLDWLRL